MKKIIISLLFVSFLGTFAIANAVESNSTNDVQEITNASGWSDYTTVYTLAKKIGSGWTTSRNQNGYTVQKDHNDNFRIYYRGKWCSVSYSYVDKYPYKFSSSSGVWYFDM